LRGAILVAAVFDAFLSIYEKRIAPLLRLATGGSGELPSGAIPPDLVEKLAEAASKSATHVLTMCVRALDYSPPVDITFGEFLRAIITADYDLVRDDDMGYRVAFIEAFRHRGIYPRDLRTLSVESLRWRSPLEDELRPSPQLLSGLEKVRAWSRENEHTSSRETQFQVSRAMRAAMHEWLARHFEQGTAGEADARFLGLSPGRDGTYEFEVHALRVANRVGPDGDLLRQMVLEILQEREEPVDPRGPGRREDRRRGRLHHHRRFAAARRRLLHPQERGEQEPPGAPARVRQRAWSDLALRHLLRRRQPARRAGGGAAPGRVLRWPPPPRSPSRSACTARASATASSSASARRGRSAT
jgi:hypothetical protein